MKSMIVIGAMLAGAAVARGGNPQVVPLRGGEPQGGLDAIARFDADAKGAKWVNHVTAPALSVYLPEPAKSVGTAVVICPGGGYSGEAMLKEGIQPAHWLNSLGVAGIVLTYRLPHGETTLTQPPAPLEDAQRAIRLVRSHAAAWHINPEKVGMMGFSAGGHLAATAGTHFEATNAGAADAVDRLSDRPDFLILIYPVISMEPGLTHVGSRNNLLGKAPSTELADLYSNEKQVTPKTPPAFIAYAKNDRTVLPGNSIAFAEAEKANGVPVELHVYNEGGHGFGLGVWDSREWPTACTAWLKARGFLPAKP